MFPPRFHERRAWPGLDGWLLICLNTAMWTLSTLRGGTGFEDFQLVLTLATALWLLWASSQRSYVPEAVPAASGVRPLVVVPTHNNAGTIADIVARCIVAHPEVLVIDDGSTDGTGALAEEAGGTLVTHPSNLGKGAALETALEWAAQHGYSHIIAIDADGQHYPEDLPAFLAAVRAEPNAIHAGVRDMSESPKDSTYARANSNFWVWVETSYWIGDTQCGFRAYPVAPIRSLALPPSRYQWEVEVLVRAAWAGVAVKDLPCRVFYPSREERVSSYRKVRDTILVTWTNATLVAARILWPPRWLRVQPRSSWTDAARGSLLGWRLVILSLRVLGRRTLHLLVVPLAGFYWLFAGTQREAIERYLVRRFPEATAWQRRRMAYRVMLNFARSLIDRFVMLIHGPSSIPIDRTEAQGAKSTVYGGSGLLLITAHVGNSDLVGASLRGKNSRRVNLMLHAQASDPYMMLFREYAGENAPNIIALASESNMASLDALRALRRDEVVALKGDRRVDDRTAKVTLLGAPARMPTGPFLLAALSNAEVVVMAAFMEPDGRYKVVSTDPRRYSFASRKSRDADLQRWAQELADTLGGWTERWPLQWYNFHDVWDMAPTEDSGSTEVSAATP